ncbi:MAG TPA: bifunctional 4-hydroxy-3-methylbut-2-enyl diphosphate reductase/30S ribosomal protein S1 [Oscillospiraceae bacterium]|nr:bifunctional 4-hydroxy-3-methylbut-2-enyl diphosphate reductase/30S ribosomal protein S1 [Oscillospiraceae bacterium]
MELILAKTAGFCFGVRRAVETAERFAERGEPAATLGELIHNPDVVGDLAKRGVPPVNSPEECPPEATLIIRSHGVSPEVIRKIRELGLSFCDATCPFVEKIHRIADERTAAGDILLIMGDPDHAETKGILGHCGENAAVLRNLGELERYVKNEAPFGEKCHTLLSQTTFLRSEWKKCEEFAKKVYTNLKIFDTICHDAYTKQREAELLSERCDRMIVAGGKKSSNTARLYETCAAHCPSVLVEDPSELRRMDWTGSKVIGVTAGASTPSGIIKEVLETMSEILENKPEEEMSFAELLDQSFKNGIHNGEKVTGRVEGFTPMNEIIVSVGTKHTGYIAPEELSEDPNVKPQDIVKVGDELQLIVLHVDDREGTVSLSKKKIDAEKNFQKVADAAESGEILEGIVVEVVKGGVIAVTDGIRVFIPASQATASRNEPLEGLLKQNVRFRILEVNPGRKRAIGSIRSVLSEERKAREAVFWEEIEPGRVYTGKVKSLTSYGAFVDLGGVDGMVHVSELSWLRVAHPSDVVKVGDVLEVYVKDVDKEAKKISLGYKKPENNPWEILRREYPVGTICTVKVVSMTAFGAFAQVIPGIDGLIHISQISYDRIAKPQDVLSVGQEVEVKITDIDFDKKRVSLSIKALLEPPVKAEAPAEAVAEAPAEVPAEAPAEE